MKWRMNATSFSVMGVITTIADGPRVELRANALADIRGGAVRVGGPIVARY